jgi:hypothetical protein
MELFSTLATAGQGINATPEFMRQLEEQATQQLGLDVDYDEVAKREKAQQDAAQALQDSSQAAAVAPATAAAPVDPAAAGDQAVDQFQQAAMALTSDDDDAEEILLTLASDEALGEWLPADDDAAMGRWV